MSTPYTASPISYVVGSGDGYYEFYGLGIDNAGNMQTSDTANIVFTSIDTMPEPFAPIIINNGQWAKGSVNFVQWNISEPTLSTYVWYQDITSATTAISDIVPSGVEMYVAEGLINGHEYRYRVRHIDETTEGRVSPWSEFIYVTQDADKPVTFVDKYMIQGAMLRMWSTLK